MSNHARRFLFSDSDGSFSSPNHQQTSGSSRDGSLFSPSTPSEPRLGTRRKLSMSASPFGVLSTSVEENSPLCQSGSRDSAYSSSVTSSQKPSMSSWMSLNSTPSTLSSVSSDHGVVRSPLSEIQPSTCGGYVMREHLVKGALGKPACERVSDKENVLPIEVVSPHYRPSSLPSLSSCQPQYPDPQMKGGCLTQQSPDTQAMGGTSRGAKAKSFCRQISSPLGRMSLVSPTGRPKSSYGASRPSSVTSVSESDGYFSEVFDGEELEEEPPISFAVSSLIHSNNFDPSPMTSKVFKTDEVVRPTPVRPLGKSEATKASLEQRRGSLKRSSPMTGLNELHRSKRPPLPFSSSSQDSPPSVSSTSTPVQGSLLLRSQSCCMPPVQSPVYPGSASNEEGYIGDFSKPFALPLVEGSVRDLKCISVDTLSDLLEEKYKDVVSSYTLLDCRFPYEYNGGHIQGAKNIWTPEQLNELLFSEPLVHPQQGSRDIFIFHCEFSSKRGPKMSRFLRENDRRRNGMNFPKLYYPEVYLLEGGYKAFYEKYSDLCSPRGYCPMVDAAHTEELRSCKFRSKSWNEDNSRVRRRPPQRHRHSTHESKCSKQL